MAVNGKRLLVVREPNECEIEGHERVRGEGIAFKVPTILTTIGVEMQGVSTGPTEEVQATEFQCIYKN